MHQSPLKYDNSVLTSTAPDGHIHRERIIINNQDTILTCAIVPGAIVSLPAQTAILK